MSYNAMLHCGRYRMRPQGSPTDLERRRLHAIELLRHDIPVHVVAERLGVDRRSVRRWKSTHRRRGRAGLRARPTPGRPPKLTAAQRQRLARLVVAGPEAAGYRTGLWTCRRIVDLIRRQFEVLYHPDHVGRLLRACGFSPQRPQPRAKERADRRVREWVRFEWATVKKTAPARRSPRGSGGDGVLDAAGAPPYVGAVREDPDAARANAVAREGLRDWRPDRIAPAPAHQLGVGAASATQHSRPRGGAVSAPSRPSCARAFHPALGPRALPPTRTRADLARGSSALPHRLVSAVRPRPQPRGTPLGLPQVRPPGQLRPRHARGHPDGGHPRAPTRGTPSGVAEEFLSPLGAAVSCLT